MHYSIAVYWLLIELKVQLTINMLQLFNKGMVVQSVIYLIGKYCMAWNAYSTM